MQTTEVIVRTQNCHGLTLGSVKGAKMGNIQLLEFDKIWDLYRGQLEGRPKEQKYAQATWSGHHSHI